MIKELEQSGKEIKPPGYSLGTNARLIAAFAAGLGAGIATSVPTVGAQEDGGGVPTEEIAGIAETPLFEVTGPENVYDKLNNLPSKGAPIADATTALIFVSQLPGFSIGVKRSDKKLTGDGELIIVGDPLVPGEPRRHPTVTTQPWFLEDPDGNRVWAGYAPEEPTRVEVKRLLRQPLSPEPFVGEVSPRSKPVTNWEIYASDGKVQGWFFTEINARNKGFLVEGEFWQAYAENVGQEALGLPKTRQFQYKGQEVQVLQNGVLQREEDGTVNVLSNHELLTNLSLVPNEAKTLGPEPWGKTFSFGGGTLVIANDTLSAVRVADMETVQKVVELINHPNSKIKSFWSSSPVTDQILAGLVPSKTRNTVSARMSDRGIMEATAGYFAGPTSTGDMYRVLHIYTPGREEEERRADPESPSFSTSIIGGSIETVVLFGNTVDRPDRYTIPDWLSPYSGYFSSKNYDGFEFLGRPQINEEAEE